MRTLRRTLGTLLCLSLSSGCAASPQASPARPAPTPPVASIDAVPVFDLVLLTGVTDNSSPGDPLFLQDPSTGCRYPATLHHVRGSSPEAVAWVIYAKQKICGDVTTPVSLVISPLEQGFQTGARVRGALTQPPGYRMLPDDNQW